MRKPKRELRCLLELGKTENRPVYEAPLPDQTNSYLGAYGPTGFTGCQI